MPKSIVKDIKELTKYRKTKFNSLEYVVSIDASSTHKNATVVNEDECNLECWLKEDNRRVQLSKYVSDRVIEDIRTLHQLWFDDYSHVRSIYYKDADGLISKFFSSRKPSQHELDKAQSYMADLRKTHEMYNEKMKFLESRVAIYC